MNHREELRLKEIALKKSQAEGLYRNDRYATELNLYYYELPDGTPYNGTVNFDPRDGIFYTGVKKNLFSKKLKRLERPKKVDTDVKELPKRDRDTKNYENSFVGSDEFELLAMLQPGDNVEDPLKKISLMLSRALPFAKRSGALIPNETGLPQNVANPKQEPVTGIPQEPSTASRLRPSPEPSPFVSSEEAINQMKAIRRSIMELIKNTNVLYGQNKMKAYNDLGNVLREAMNEVTGTAEEQIPQLSLILSQGTALLNELQESIPPNRETRMVRRPERPLPNIEIPETVPTLNQPSLKMITDFIKGLIERVLQLYTETEDQDYLTLYTSSQDDFKKIKGTADKKMKMLVDLQNKIEARIREIQSKPNARKRGRPRLTDEQKRENKEFSKKVVELRRRYMIEANLKFTTKKEINRYVEVALLIEPGDYEPFRTELTKLQYTDDRVVSDERLSSYASMMPELIQSHHDFYDERPLALDVVISKLFNTSLRKTREWMNSNKGDEVRRVGRTLKFPGV